MAVQHEHHAVRAGQPASTVEAKRKRKLLLHKWQVQELRTKSEQKGLTIVPLALYFQRGFAKLEIALAKGKKLTTSAKASPSAIRSAKPAASSSIGSKLFV